MKVSMDRGPDQVVLEKHVPLQTLDDVIGRMSNAKVCHERQSWAIPHVTLCKRSCADNAMSETGAVLLSSLLYIN